MFEECTLIKLYLTLIIKKSDMKNLLILSYILYYYSIGISVETIGKYQFKE